MSRPHPIYVVDDDLSIRRSIKFLVDHLRRPCRLFEDGSAFLKEARNLDPGVVLLDLRMPHLDGHAVQDEMGKRGLCFPIVVLTGHGSVSEAVLAMKAGAVDFLEKPFRHEELVAAIAHGDAILDDREVASASRDEAARRINALTPRERDVLAGLAKGLPNKTVAYDLGISPRTVEVHRANLMDKLEARSLADLLRIAFAAGASQDSETSATT